MKTLSLFVQDNSLRSLYEETVLRHNLSIDNDEYADSGFDLLLAQEVSVEVGTVKIDYEIKAAMYESEVGSSLVDSSLVDSSLADSSLADSSLRKPCAFCVYTRSSIHKTPLRMTNNVGIIDRGYRGNLCSVFDASAPVDLKRGQRLTQICSPDLVPFRVELVFSIDDLGKTQRGEGGFGSTGA